MLMGKVVSKTKYEYYEYVVAVLISIGMAAFLMGSDEGKKVIILTLLTILLPFTLIIFLTIVIINLNFSFLAILIFLPIHNSQSLASTIHISP